MKESLRGMQLESNSLPMLHVLCGYSAYIGTREFLTALKYNLFTYPPDKSGAYFVFSLKIDLY